MKRLTGIFLILLITGINSYSQVKAFVDTNVIDFAGQTVLHLQIRIPNNVSVFFPQFKADTIADKVEIVENYSTDTVKKSPLIVEKKYKITSFEDSIRTIPAIPVIVGRDTFYSQPLQIYVKPLQMDSTEIAKLDTTQIIPVFDIKKQYEPKFTFKEFWLRFGRWILIALILIGLMVAVWYIIKRYKENRPIKLLEKPKEPAHIIALRSLNELKEKKLYEKGKVKEFYTELTNIIRTYIEQRFRVPALERTSSEILADFRIYKIVDSNQIDILQSIFTSADLAKFAKYKPTPDIADKNLKDTVYFVEQTKEKEIQGDNNENENKKQEVEQQKSNEK